MREAVRAALVLFFILSVCFFPFIWGSKTLLESARDTPSILAQGAWAGQPTTPSYFKVLDPGAPAYTTEAWLAFIRSQYLYERTLPLWNPYQAYGAPMAANMQSQPFYPLTFLLSIRLTPRTYNWYILFRLFQAGLFGYLYLRLFLSFPSALAGGIASMLAGYYVLYITMPHLSVETLLPASLLAGECLLRKQNYISFVSFAVILLLVILGGMPESALLLLTFLYTYLFFRLLSDPILRPKWMRFLSHLCMSSVAGLGLSLFFLLPFYEYLRHSLNGHDPAHTGTFAGLIHDKLTPAIFSYLFPLLFGPPFSSDLSGDTGLRNYWGVVCLFLILVSAFPLFRRTRDDDPRLRSLSFFFLFFGIFAVLKRYGCVPVNLLGSLPLFRMVLFPKYEEAILSICIAVLSAIGLEQLRRRQVSIRSQAAALGLALLTVPVALVFSRLAITRELHVGHLPPDIPKLAIGIPLGLLLCLGISLALFSWQGTEGVSPGPSAPPKLATCILVLLTVELSLNYITPVYYMFNELPSRANNPYVGAPYIKFLQAHREGSYRAFGRDGVLMPSWASAFGISDIRDLDAMYYDKYFPFLDNFFPSRQGLGPELDSCFRGLGPYEFTGNLQRRLLQLSSVKYIATISAYFVPNPRVEEVLRQNRGHLIPGRENLIGTRGLALGGVVREMLGEHPPYERLPYNLQIGDTQSVFHFSYGLDPAVFDKTTTDGVGFTIELKDPSGNISKVFSNYIDPKHNASQRHWMDGEIDLTKYRGKTVTLLFTTDPGPIGNTAYDWAGWSNFHFDGEEPPAAQLPFRNVYSGEAQVYEYDKVLPRAAIYSHASLENGEAEVLHRLADPSLDVFESVVLDKSKLSPNQVQAIDELNRSASLPVRPASITSYKAQTVTIHASLDRNGILVLNDSDYPGWVVDVDGHPSTWFTANYMFRGVLLTAGIHSIEFAYQPESFHKGALLSAGTFLCLSLVGLAEVWRRRQWPVAS